MFVVFRGSQVLPQFAVTYRRHVLSARELKKGEQQRLPRPYTLEQFRKRFLSDPPHLLYDYLYNAC